MSRLIAGNTGQHVAGVPFPQIQLADEYMVEARRQGGEGFERRLLLNI